MTALLPTIAFDDVTADEGLSRKDGMIWIPGGTFRMGSDNHYAEEAPSHRVSVDGFWIDRTPVTNRQFKAFVRATGHVTFTATGGVEVAVRSYAKNKLIGQDTLQVWVTDAPGVDAGDINDCVK